MSAVSLQTLVFQSAGNWPGVEGSMVLLAIILLAGAGTGALFVISLLAYRQRRSLRYLLVTIAVGALFFRSIVGVGTVLGVVPMPVHHLLEHSLDFLIAGVILFAVFRAAPGNFGSAVEDG